MIDPEKLLEIIAGFERKLTGLSGLTNWAAGLLARDIETDSLIRLAGLTEAESDEAPGLLRKVVSEWGFRYPTEAVIGVAYARLIAKRILDGQVEPNEGCARIAEINQRLGWPDELTTFGMLAHEQTGHEHIGIKGTVPEIMSAAQALVELELSLARKVNTKRGD